MLGELYMRVVVQRVKHASVTINGTINGKINKVIIENKDRLTRFQFNLIEKFFNSYNVEIEISNKKADRLFPSACYMIYTLIYFSISASFFSKSDAPCLQIGQIKSSGNSSPS